MAKKVFLCPECKKGKLIEILFGDPSHIGEKKEKDGKIWLGGCIEPKPPVPTHHCRACGNDFFGQRPKKNNCKKVEAQF